MSKNIIVTGPDGSGKSTLVEALCNELNNRGLNYTVKWMRFQRYTSKLLDILGRINGKSYYIRYEWGRFGYHDYKGFFGIVYIYAVLLDHLLFTRFIRRFILSAGKRYVFDRYLIDTVVDLVIDTDREELIMKLFYPYLKKEKQDCLIFILDCPKKVVIKRRPDVLDDKNYQQKAESYRMIAKRLGCCVIDTGVLNIEESVRFALTKIHEED